METLVFQKGDYPVRQVIFTGMDSVTGALFMSTMFKPKYGRVDIDHEIRRSGKCGPELLDALKASTRPVFCTCKRPDDVLKVLDEYISARGWSKGDVRVYNLATRII